MNLNIKQKYFDGKISHGFVALFAGKTIVTVATGLIGMFMPIFWYNTFDQNFGYVLVYYIVSLILYILIVPVGAKFLSSFGFRRAMRLSIFFLSLFYATLYMINNSGNLNLVIVAILFLLTYRILYWLPYHIDFAKFTNRKNRGRQVSAIMAVGLIIAIFIPIISGSLIEYFDFGILFIIAIVLVLASGIPYLMLPRTNENFSWTYKEVFRQLTFRKRRSTLLAFAADGAESAIGFVVWPIFIFQLLKGNYFQVGALSTLMIGATAILQLFLGKYVDKKKKEKIMHLGSFFCSLGWIVKIFIATAFQIFIVGAYHNIARIFIRTPFDTLYYEIAADEGHYVDEFTVLHEIAINMGKISALILVFIISFYFPIQWSFVIAAIASIALNLLRTRQVLPIRKVC